MSEQQPDPSRFSHQSPPPGAALPARLGLLLGIIGLGLFLLPVLRLMIGLLLPPVISPSPIAAFLFPLSLALSFLFSLGGVLVAAPTRHTPGQEKRTQRALLLCSSVLACSVALGLLYVLTITAGFS
jgi:hypothetical protein